MLRPDRTLTERLFAEGLLQARVCVCACARARVCVRVCAWLYP